MRIVIDTVPHKEQRYNTVGDWYIQPDGTWHITISEMSDWRHFALVAVHELIEMALCVNDGISSEMVDRFDVQYEAARPEGDLSEAGDSPDAPYHREHCVANAVERLMCVGMGVNWQEYEDAINNL